MSAIDYLLGGGSLIGLGGTIVFAYYAVKRGGEANAAGDRARLAEAKADAAEARANVAAATAASATSERDAARAALAATQHNLEGAISDRLAAYEKLAKLGAPVGAPLVDSALDSLYPNGDGGSPGASAVHGDCGPLPDAAVGLPVAPAGKPSA